MEGTGAGTVVRTGTALAVGASFVVLLMVLDAANSEAVLHEA